MVSIESELERVSEKLERLRKELEQMACNFELVHEDVVRISQKMDRLIVRFMELKKQANPEQQNETNGR